MSASVLERSPGRERPSVPPDAAPDRWSTDGDAPVEWNRPIHLENVTARSVCVLPAPRPRPLLHTGGWLGLVSGRRDFLPVVGGMLALLLGLVLTVFDRPVAGPAPQSAAGPAEQPAAQPTARPTPPPAGPGFVAFAGTASEPVRFVVHRSPNRLAAVPGALLFDWQDSRGYPPVRLRLGSRAIEPEVDRASSVDGAAETLRYRSVWPGIDAVIRTLPTGTAYDLIVQPGTSPSVIDLEYENVTELTIGSDGRLRGRGPAGDWSDSPPESWQDGPSGREMVPTRYQLRGGSRFGFVVGPYDPSRPLVVDPEVKPVS